MKPVEAGHDCFVGDNIAALRSGNAALHAFNKGGLMFQHAGNGFFHDLRGVLALAGSKLLKLGFRGGCEMNFHASDFKDDTKESQMGMALSCRWQLPVLSSNVQVVNEGICNDVPFVPFTLFEFEESARLLQTLLAFSKGEINRQGIGIKKMNLCHPVRGPLVAQMNPGNGTLLVRKHD